MLCYLIFAKEVNEKRVDVYLVVMPEASYVFLIILHIRPAFKLLGDFGRILQTQWELLHNRHIIAQRIDEIIDIENI